MIINCCKHFKLIWKHKWYVFKECCKRGIIWQGIIHDVSKFYPSEFFRSAKYFRGDMSPIEAEAEVVGYSYAWRYHKGRNFHHWQWYVDFKGKNSQNIIELNPAPMPDKYILEMYCDMKGAAKAYGKDGIKEYYLANKKDWVLHEETQEKWEALLMKEEGFK